MKSRGWLGCALRFTLEGRSSLCSLTHATSKTHFSFLSHGDKNEHHMRADKRLNGKSTWNTKTATVISRLERVCHDKRFSRIWNGVRTNGLQ